MNRKRTSAVSEQFYPAAKDYLFLLERNYPQKTIVKLVGDRYMLTAAERVLLYRGIVPDHKVALRKKVKAERILPGSRVFADGFNVVRTVGSYLNGNFVFTGMDGFLRDVSELHRKRLRWEVLERAVMLILDFLELLKPEQIVWFFDKPVSHSGKMTEFINKQMKIRSLKGGASAVYSPDHELKEVAEGYICSADSAVIDGARVPVFDLAAAVLKNRFNADFFEVTL